MGKRAKRVRELWEEAKVGKEEKRGRRVREGGGKRTDVLEAEANSFSTM